MSQTLCSLPGVSERRLPLLRWISHLKPVGGFCCPLLSVVSTRSHMWKGCFAVNEDVRHSEETPLNDVGKDPPISFVVLIGVTS